LKTTRLRRAMISKPLIDEILKLSAEERLDLIERIWDSLSAEGRVPVPEWHRRELVRRLQDPSPQHLHPNVVHAQLKLS
jgi:putative addiction module component (TIGR02574 family)